MFLQPCDFSLSQVKYLPSGPDDIVEEDDMFNSDPESKPEIRAGDIVLHRTENQGSFVITCKFVPYCQSITKDEEDTKQPIVLLSADGMGLSYFGGVTVKIFWFVEGQFQHASHGRYVSLGAVSVVDSELLVRSF